MSTFDFNKAVQGVDYTEETYIETLGMDVPLRALSGKELNDADKLALKHIFKGKITPSQWKKMSRSGLPDDIEIDGALDYIWQQHLEICKKGIVSVSEVDDVGLNKLGKGVVEEIAKNILRISGSNKEGEAEAKNFREE